VAEEGWFVLLMPLKVSMNGHGLSSKHLMEAHRQVGSHTQKMATGKRINSAADDAANAGVANNLSAQRMGTRAALRNISDGVSIMNTVEEATNTVADKIMRMRELAIQGSSDLLDFPERFHLQEEMQSLHDEMNRISASTEFNGINLADGSTGFITVQMGTNDSQYDRLRLRLPDLSTTSLFSGTVGVKSVKDSQGSIGVLDRSMDLLNRFRSGFGANQHVMSAATAQVELYGESMSAAESRIEDADYAHQSAQLARAQMILRANMAVRSQAGVVNQSVTALL